MKNVRIRKGSILDRMTNRKLLKNKLYSMGLILLGYISTKLLGDSTVFILMLILGLPMFFAKENVID